ncbi:MAG: protein translocase subunit SecDF [Crocinitomicaceae bacterium]|nr:protein translocase subunit SecDF [Crocinitomicaceae bacterium]
MRNKGFFWGVTIVLVLACIYQLSFTWATSRVENDAVEYADDMLDSLTDFSVDYIVADKDTLYVDTTKHVDAIRQHYVDQYLRDQANKEVFFGYTYAECQEKEINLGLDLEGGMSVTLEISIPELVKELAGNTRNPDFRIAHENALSRYRLGEGDFIDLFDEEFTKNAPNTSLAQIYHTRNQDLVEPDATNDEVISFLKEQANSALDGVEIIIEKRVNSFGVAQPTIQKQTGSNRIFVELPGVKDVASVRRKIQSTANLEFFEVYDNLYDGVGQGILYAEQVLSQALYGDELEQFNDGSETNDSDSTDVFDTFETNADGDSTETANETEVTEEEVAEETEETEQVDPFLDAPDETAETTDEFLEANPDDTTGNAAGDQMSPEERRLRYPISNYLQPYVQMDENQQLAFIPGAAVGQASIKDTSILNTHLNHSAFRSVFPDELQFMWSAKEGEDRETRLPNGTVVLYAIKVPREGAKVNGEHIASSYVGTQGGEVSVIMNMTNRGSDVWGEMTEENLQKPVAITMDNYVFSAPTVQEKMNYTSSITGGFSLQEARDLSGLLNAGALPAPVNIVDEAIVGPSIGGDNVRAGMYSFIGALLIVLIYMVFYYAKAGAVADLALVLNIFLIFGTLASMKAILTLPGIAGIVLTIGMAVDANVLIFERVREELRNGKGLKTAVSDGYKKALSSILDANITTLLTGVVLVTFGTGPIKGFAVTLIIGIFTSFFAALVLTRLVITWFFDREKEVSFSTKMTKNWFVNTAIPFVRKRKLFYIVSGLLIVVGIGSLVGRGLDLGVDFQGGRVYTLEFEKPADRGAIRESLTAQFDGNEPLIKKVDNDYKVMITTKYLVSESNEETNNLIEEKLQSGLEEIGFGEYEILTSKMIAPTISKDLTLNSSYAIGFSLLIIFLYIVIRFRRWQFGLGALIAMAHDVTIVLALFSIFWGILPFSMEIDQAFIAAILTVVGYSINDTVVVFDRIREYLGLHRKKGRKEVINLALNSTMSRTINTSVSTFIVLLVIFIFGGEAIRGFTFALMIGVIVGTYSSLFIATPAVIDFTKDTDKAVKEVQ